MSACAAVEPEGSFARVQGLVQPPTGATLRWQRDDADAEAIAEEVRRLLADGLTRQTAIRVALLNNPKLQANLEELGMSQADLVQAGLPSNPTLSLFPAFPIAAGNSAGSLLAFVSDLWVLPARRDVAATENEATIRRVAAAVVLTAGDAAKAYDDALYRAALLDVEKTIRDIRSATAARTRKQAGEAHDDLALLRAEAEALQQELALARAEKDVVTTRLRLAIVLGMADDGTLPAFAETFGPPPAEGWTTATAIPFALEHRFDVAAAREDVAAAEQQISLQQRMVLGNVQLGPGYTGGLESEDSGGPAMQMTLPLFDQNQAQIAKAEFALRQQRKQLVALENKARREITEALADIAFYRRNIDLYQMRLAPLQTHAVEQAEKMGARNDVYVLHALEARQEEVDGRRGFLEAVRQLRAAQVRLQSALWTGSTS